MKDFRDRLQGRDEQAFDVEAADHFERCSPTADEDAELRGEVRLLAGVKGRGYGASRRRG